jgi:hypothetical protein
LDRGSHPAAQRRPYDFADQHAANGRFAAVTQALKKANAE